MKLDPREMLVPNLITYFENISKQERILNKSYAAIKDKGLLRQLSNKNNVSLNLHLIKKTYVRLAQIVK